jgi:S-adenosylmethionine/arginine decarboxylase-like enzyme
MALDIFTCGGPDPDTVLQTLLAVLRPEKMHVVRQTRGDRF